MITLFMLGHGIINEMSVKNSIIVFLFLTLFAYSLFTGYNRQTVYGDGIFYYSWLRSIVIDRDINFTNEYAYFSVNQLPTKTGLIGNQFAIGPALFWSPAFLLVHTLLRGDGYGFWYQYAVGFINVLYFITGVILLARIVLKKNNSLLPVLGFTIGTNLLFYGALDTVTSHAVSFFISSVLLSFLLEAKRSWFILGILCGVMGLIRIQDSAIILIPFLLLSFRLTFLSFRLVRNLLTLFLGFIFPLSLQFFTWFLLYGDFRIPYIERGYGFNFLHPEIFNVLFSTNNGLLLWTPLVAIALVGTIWSLFKQNCLFPKSIHAVTLLYFLWQTYLISSWSIWWQGASYSGRMFISVIPFLFLGLTELDHLFPKFTKPLIFASCFLNVMLIGYYFLGYQR